MMERIEKDRLNDWFARLPDKKLPADFQTLLMERIRQEALLRAERRKERLNLLGMGVLIISLLGGLAVLFFFLGISWQWPQWRISLPEMSTFLFYAYIGALAFALWMADTAFRRYYCKKSPHEST